MIIHVFRLFYLPYTMARESIAHEIAMESNASMVSCDVIEPHTAS